MDKDVKDVETHLGIYPPTLFWNRLTAPHLMFEAKYLTWVLCVRKVEHEEATWAVINFADFNSLEGKGSSETIDKAQDDARDFLLGVI